jgi:hypothetical protein
MRSAKPTIAALMVVIFIAALGFAALSRPSRLWAAVMFSTATAMLTLALVGALCASGRARAGYLGFAVTGWTYLLLQYGPFFETQVGPYTLPTAILDVAYPIFVPQEVVTPSPAPPPGAGGMMTGMMLGTGQYIAAGGAAGPPGGSGPAGVFTPASPLGPTSPLQAWTAIDRGFWGGTSTCGSFYRIGHSLFALVIACVGAIIARRMSRRDGPGSVAV